MKALLCLFCFLSFSAFANSSLAIIDALGNKTVYTAEQLLRHPDVIRLTLKKDIVYSDHQLEYTAVPVHSLISKSQIDTDSIIQFKATDGFSAPLPQQELLNKNPNQAIAYVAIEETPGKWPNLKGRDFSAAPFYLIWVNPDYSNISGESWPFQLAALEIKDAFEHSYPNVVPASDIAKTSDIYAGFQSFVKNCFVCHKMNNEGEGVIGPDLNLPMNPTDYFKDAALKKLIRNPASVRTWQNQLMGSFDESMLSEQELDQLIAYLKHMSNN